MANPSIYIPDELLKEFDDELWERKTAGEVHRDVSRSEFVQEAMRQYIEGNWKLNSEAREKTTATTD